MPPNAPETKKAYLKYKQILHRVPEDKRNSDALMEVIPFENLLEIAISAAMKNLLNTDS